MTPTEYTAALTTLGLTTTQAADWLGVSVRTVQRYAKTGPCGPAERALRLALVVQNHQPIIPSMDWRAK